MRKQKVGIIFGGRSVEHEISIISAHQVMKAINKDKYEIVPIYITKQGHWLIGKALLKFENFIDLDLKEIKANRGFIVPDTSVNWIVRHPEPWWLRRRFKEQLDVVFPLVHGTHGEDGTLQGLLELADIPYVGAGVLGSAVGMDKIIMKSVFKERGLPVLNYLWFTRKKWESHPEEQIKSIELNLKYPLFVKPSNLGSSIGISKVNNREELKFALDVASYYDRRIIVEEALEDAEEINCAVLGNDDPIPSVCEQPISWTGFLDYTDKYLRGSKVQGIKSTPRRLPAPISKELTEEIQRMAVEAFKAIDCRSIARVDFLVDKTQKKPYINEINTIPGSLAFYLWEPMGIGFSELIERLIELAFEAHREKKKTTFSYDSHILRRDVWVKNQSIT